MSVCAAKSTNCWSLLPEPAAWPKARTLPRAKQKLLQRIRFASKTLTKHSSYVRTHSPRNRYNRTVPEIFLPSTNAGQLPWLHHGCRWDGIIGSTGPSHRNHNHHHGETGHDYQPNG